VANDPKYLENYLGYRLKIWSVASHVGHVAPKFLAYD